MKDKTTEALRAYEKIEHWPPYTYQNYPDVTPESLRSFIDFLGTENTSPQKKEIQPWIPFCDSKCTFCYFPTESCSKNRIERYLTTLKKALKMYAETRYARSSEFIEIYFGGGTPSVLSSEQLVDLLSYCGRNFNVSENRMIKIAGCSHNFDEKKLKSVSNYGVDQVDLGIQTFDDGIRKILNLRDDSGEVEQTIKTARRLGLYVSIDLMFNLPGQTMESWRNDIQKALELDVESVDCYPLDVYPSTILATQLQSSQVLPIGDSHTEAKMYQEAYNMFTKSGYNPTCHNRFSRIAEDFGEPCFEILGTGAGFFMGHLRKYSYVEVEPVSAYIDLVNNGRFPVAKLSVLSEEDEMRKMMMRLCIRLSVDKHEFQKRFKKLPEDVFPAAINTLRKKGLIEIDDREIKLTKLGDMWRFNIAWEFGPCARIR
jgi:coproporphyrinogen III oxidase-like Fe-S oxidoreductase